MIFCKKSGGLVFSAKVQNYPDSNEIGRNLHKIQNIPSKAAAIKRALLQNRLSVTGSKGPLVPVTNN
jgi:hypothetical protein